MMFIKFLTVTLSAMILTNCSGKFPVPGGANTTNETFYISKNEMKERIEKIKTGMSKDEVFSILGRTKEELTLLDREKVMSTIFGGEKPDSTLWNGGENYQKFIQSLSGYRLNYKIVKRKHGIKNPITIQTNKVGFDYAAIFIFKEDYLYEAPIISGGVIDDSSSKTIFDLITPNMVVKGAGL